MHKFASTQEILGRDRIVLTILELNDNRTGLQRLTGMELSQRNVAMNDP